MRTVVREKLRKYLSEHGKDVLQEPEALRWYLLREEGRFSQEIDGLLRLVEEGLLPPFPGEGERQPFLQKVVRGDRGFPGGCGVASRILGRSLGGSGSSSGILFKKSGFGEPGRSSEDVPPPLSSFQMFLENPATFSPQTLSSAESFLRSSPPPREETESPFAKPEDGEISPTREDVSKDTPQEEVTMEMRQMFVMSPSSEVSPGEDPLRNP